MMVQRHSFILWSNPNSEDYQVTVNKVYDLLTVLKEFGPELSPIYITAKRKKDAQIFDGEKKTLEELLKKGVNKEGKTEFPDLGYRISFFSSKKEDESAGISILAGVKDQKLINSFIVNLPLSFPVYSDTDMSNNLINLFKQCIRIFDPFWACISNNVNIRRYDGYWNEQSPTTVHWVNYFNNEVTQKMGKDKVASAPMSRKEKYNRGTLLILKNKPINDEDEEEIKLQHFVNKHFKFE
jgi:hypothetical protein